MVPQVEPPGDCNHVSLYDCTAFYRTGILPLHANLRGSDQSVHHQYPDDLYPGRNLRGTQLHTKGVIKVVDNDETASEKAE